LGELFEDVYIASHEYAPYLAGLEQQDPNESVIDSEDDNPFTCKKCADELVKTKQAADRLREAS
jgi:hypothetical protein